MRKHDNWRNYEQAVEEATDAWLSLGRVLDHCAEYRSGELFAPAVRAEYALGDAVTALQEAETWHQARSALLFWAVRYAVAADFVETCRVYERSERSSWEARAYGVARELELTAQQLSFCLAELESRLTTFKEIRPQSVGAASRIAYLEHRHS